MELPWEAGCLVCLSARLKNGSSHGDIWGQKSHEAITIMLHYACFFTSVEMSCFTGALNSRNNSLPKGLEPAISN